MLRFKAIPDTVIYEIGERIGQLIILPYPQVNFIEVDDLSSSDRASSGFGSTGK
jgi:dUTP pyrophosphatase